jgi:membrane protein YqaA with SNARE-associated domain
MDFVQLATDHGAYVTLAVVSFLSAVFPLVNAELAVVGLAAGMPGANILLLVAVATGAQMVGKSTMYWLGRRGSAVTRGKYAQAIERWGHRFRGSGRSVSALLFVSSASGLPPFYVISALAGVFKTSFLGFLLVGTAGRFLRFTAVGLSPLVFRTLT